MLPGGKVLLPEEAILPGGRMPRSTAGRMPAATAPSPCLPGDARLAYTKACPPSPPLRGVL